MLRRADSSPEGSWGLFQGGLRADAVHIPGRRHLNSPLGPESIPYLILASHRFLLQSKEKRTEIELVRPTSNTHRRPQLFGVAARRVGHLLRNCCPAFPLRCKMSAKLLRLMEKGFLPPKEIAEWRAAVGDGLSSAVGSPPEKTATGGLDGMALVPRGEDLGLGKDVFVWPHHTDPRKALFAMDGRMERCLPELRGSSGGPVEALAAAAQLTADVRRTMAEADEVARGKVGHFVLCCLELIT